jgi:hypothetical protein
MFRIKVVKKNHTFYAHHTVCASLEVFEIIKRLEPKLHVSSFTRQTAWPMYTPSVTGSNPAEAMIFEGR